MREITDQNKNREKTYWLILTAMSLCVCILSYQLYVKSDKKVSAYEENISADVFASKVQVTEHEPLFYVAAENASVKVQDLRAEKTYILLKNVDLRTMRNIDRELFESGFYLYSEEELQKLLEDYSS